jgi:hypothetical protein
VFLAHHSRMSTLRLGELLTAGGPVPPPHLDEALRRQAQRGLPLGEQLIEMGLIERDELPELLELQAALRKSGSTLSEQAVAERLRIGQLLVDAGIISAEQLASALARSRESGRRIGDTLVASGHLSRSVLERFLRRQRRLTAVALAGVALSAALQMPEAAADQTHLHIQATVLQRTVVERQRLPQRLEVSAQDVARGYVDVAEPVEVGIRSNHPAGVSVGFALNSPQLDAVAVLAALGGEVRGHGVFVPQLERGLRASVLSLRLRLKLAPEAVPGSIAFPLALTITPL